jgi:transcriptional regulator, XRE family
MVARTSAGRSRQMVDFGDHLRTWRKASRLTAGLVAERAG